MSEVVRRAARPQRIDCDDELVGRVSGLRGCGQPGADQRCSARCIGVTDLTVSFLFDLDGTLVDSVYQHVLAWHEALQAEGIELSIWRIHRKIGMSGGLFTNMLFRETGLDIDATRIERLRKLHAAAYNRRADEVRPLPGAIDLLAYLTDAGIPWAIATSGRMETAGPILEKLGVDHDEDRRSSPATRCATPSPTRICSSPPPRRSASRSRRACVVGDSVWDMLAARRAGGLGVGLLSGGYGEDELVTGQRLPGLRGPCRPAPPHRRGRRPEIASAATIASPGTRRILNHP